MVYSNTIPDSLKSADQWICWKEQYRDDQDKPTKVPVDPTADRYASVSDPDTWSSFVTAYHQYVQDANIDGIGYVFTSDEPYTGVDLDNCRNPGSGALDSWAKDIIRQLDSYTEVSPSGTGVHVIVAGEKPDGKHRSGDVELYDQDRYFTVTGCRLDLMPADIEKQTDVLAAVHREYVAADDLGSDEEGMEPPDELADLHDKELIEQAMNASNGDKFERLWNGDISGYPSHSEADQALCNLLAYWTGGDPSRMERLFEQSGLVRDKWQEREDYRERTIKKAVRDCPAYYSP